jgi:hypothetical protein
MLLEHYVPGRNRTEIQFHDLRPEGLSIAAALGLIYENCSAHGLTMCRGLFAEGLQQGLPLIAFTYAERTPPLLHSVVVAGRDDTWVLIRDPAVGTYWERLEWFEGQRLVAPRVLQGTQAVWCVR